VTTRRGAVLALAALFTGSKTYAASTHPNGWYDPQTRSFRWDNGGADPLKVSVEKVLRDPRIAEQVSKADLEVLILKIKEARKGPPNHEVMDGERSDIMVSGKKGWIAHNVVAIPSRWKKGRSRAAWVVYHMNAEGVQYRVMFYQVCSNVAVTRYGAPVQCRCDTSKGDLCS
jgi:hypothetical protein